MKRCAIITGGKKAPLEKIDECDFVIACDLGYQYCLENNLKPDLLIGDFDSYQNKLPEDVQTIVLPVMKDDTDTMYAYRQAAMMGFEEIYLYCALGKRLDHTIANFETAYFGVDNKIRTTIFDEDNYIIITPASKLEIPKLEGYSLSVFAIDSCALSIKGTKYEVEDVVISHHFPLGQSNDWLDEVAVIDIKQGGAMIVLSKLNND